MNIDGAGKIPEIGAGVGKAIKHFNKAAIEPDVKQANKLEQADKSKTSILQ